MEDSINSIDEILDQTVIIESKMKQKCYLKSYPKAKAHIKSALYELMLSVIGEDLPLKQPFDDKYDEIEATAWQIFRKGANWSKDEQRNKLKELMK